MQHCTSNIACTQGHATIRFHAVKDFRPATTAEWLFWGHGLYKRLGMQAPDWTWARFLYTTGCKLESLCPAKAPWIGSPDVPGGNASRKQKLVNASCSLVFHVLCLDRSIGGCPSATVRCCSDPRREFRPSAGSASRT